MELGLTCKDSLGGLEVHVTGEQPERDGLRRLGRRCWGRREIDPFLEMLENYDLLEGGVGAEGLGGEVGGDAAAEVLVLLAHHVNEVVLPEELPAEGVADEVEGVGADVGEHPVGQLRVPDEEDEAADDVVGGDAERGRGGEAGLPVPEAGRVGDEAGGAAEEREDELGAGEGALLEEVGDLLEEGEEGEEGDEVGRDGRERSQQGGGHCLSLSLSSFRSRWRRYVRGRVNGRKEVWFAKIGSV